MTSYRRIPIKPADQAAVAKGEWETVQLNRRGFLKLMAASAALASAACKGPPIEHIVPYVQMPELMTLGQPLFYATAYVRRGLAQGVLVESNMGRPTKVEGNPHHPASLGATDVYAQASVLQLWDPDRSQTVRQATAISTWEAFDSALAAQRRAWDANGGAGLRILTSSVGSPTLADQLNALLQRYPNARWHSYDPLHDDAAYEAAMLAFGRPADMIYQPDRAQVVVSFDADLFGDWPGSIPYARAFVRDRRSDAPQFVSRLYAVEASPGLMGAKADHRLALPPQEIDAMVWRIAAALGMSGMPGGLPNAPSAEVERFEKTIASRLSQARGTSLVVAGGSVAPQTRALVHAMNAYLGNLGKTVIAIPPTLAAPQHHAQSLAALTQEMRNGVVSSLFVLDANPVYNAPADIEFAQALRKVPFTAHLGLYRDETARACGWHLPMAHGYEQWSDGRAFDGTASIMQPLIAPLYGGRSMHEVVAAIAVDDVRSSYALVRRYWQKRNGAGDFEKFWQGALRQGVIANSASAPLNLRPIRTIPPPEFKRAELTAVFALDSSTGAGEFANNAWLQELPRPFSKLTWDNAALLGAATAKAHGLVTGDVVRLTMVDRPTVTIDAPVLVWAGHAEQTVVLPLGYGRQAAGHVGDAVGFDAFRLKTLQGSPAIKLEKTGRRHDFAVTQGHQRMEGRDIVRSATLAEFRRNPRFATAEPRQRTPDVNLYPEWEYKEYKWGMAIDLNACIGCNACTIACQAENNIPVVGKEQVMREREMHWIRVDRYDVGPAAQPRSAFQPVPCMHCETAPCEEVCPVGATVHDSEGLNVQVYNRCVGTRFCSNNCPYKVRRFNFLKYTDTEIDRPAPAENPEVTVRRRGIMEKCNYCLQRVTRGRLDAEKEGRRIRDGEVVTACQAVCPTEAIVFGDLNDPESRVNRAKASPLDYALLSELNTRPRTTYAAVVTNPDEELS